MGAATHPLWSDSTIEDSDRELDMLVEAGANVVRIDLSWSSLEETAKNAHAQWYVNKADTFFLHARERGLRVIATLSTTPCWASTAPPEAKQNCVGAWWEPGRDVHLYPPADPADFADAAAWVAERWGDDLAALEIWNEPNCTCWFKSPNPVPEYAELLKRSYRSIKQVAPAVQVLGASLLFSDAPFLQALYEHGIGPHLDAVSIRPFSQGRDPADPTPPNGDRRRSYLEGVPWIREVMVANGDAHKRLWFTEIGWSSCSPWSTQNHWCIGADLQASYLGAALRIIRDRWDFVEAVSVYNLRNKGTDPTDRETQMGLLHRDFTPKPAYWAFKDALADLAANPLPRADPTAGQVSSAAVVSGPTADLTAPVLSQLRIRPRVLRANRRRARIAFSVSEPARVKLTLERARRRAGCRADCTRWRGLRGSLVHAATGGPNRMRFTGMLRGRRLVPGSYRLSAVARDPAGNESPVRRIRLRILP
ncbi:MAG TPA: cellulase family glycosylhydrolase [Thermoleophilaceae bacterium]|nr:cellulase family glycosylhydrolase [Thermoleophilaceae bacterium]